MSRRNSGASSVASRRSRRSNTGSDGDSQRSKEAAFFEECRGAYVAVIESTHDPITSKSQLALVLQQSGRNPSQKTLDKYWNAKTKKLTYDDFCDIMRKEKSTTTSDLLKAFKKIDINGDGFITHDELTRVLTQRGEKMTSQEVDAMISEVDDDGDKKLNYNEFCKMLMSTTSKCRQITKERIDKKIQSERKAKEKTQPASRIGRETSPTPHPRKRACINKTLPPVSKVVPKATEPRNLKTWHHAHQKGCFVLEQKKILAHQYVLDVSTSTALWLCAKPLNLHPEIATDQHHPDIQLYLLRHKDDGTAGELINFTQMKNQQKYCVHQELKPGSYRLLPMTTGCRFKPREKSPKNKTQLVKKEGDDYIIQKPFRNALADIFELVDLDGNGTLSREEFNIFQLRTSGEAVDDDAWEVVEEHFELKKGELTRKGFMDLNQMEANDLEGDTDDLWVTLHSMGFSDDLTLDEALPFVVDAYTDKCKGHLKPLPLQSGGSTLERAVCDTVITSSGQDRVTLKEVEDAALYTRAGDAIFTIVVENKSSSKFSLRLDCGKSSNCISSRPDLDHTLVVPPKAAVVGHHLMPVKESEEWTVKCTETVIA